MVGNDNFMMEIVGDFLPSRNPPEIVNKILLVPSEVTTREILDKDFK